MAFAKVLHKVGVFLLFLVVLEARVVPNRSCRQPSGRELQRIRQQFGTQEYSPRLHESFGMLRPLRTLRNISSEFIDKKQLRIEGSPNCPENVLLREDMQVCPSYFVMEYDPFRIPDTMVQAECRCTDCQDDDEQTDELRECKKIHYYTRVLRVVDCRNGVYEYDEVWEPISVGCHCVRSRALLSDSDNIPDHITGSDGPVLRP